MTKLQNEIQEFIVKFMSINDRKPYLYELCELSGRSSKSVANSLKNTGYPKELCISTYAKSISDVYLDGMTVHELADKFGVNYNIMYNYVEKLAYLGITFKKSNYEFLGKINRTEKGYSFLPKIKKVKQERSVNKEERLVSIQVKCGIYKGIRGYLDENHDVVIHIDGMAKTMFMDSFDYEVVN